MTAALRTPSPSGRCGRMEKSRVPSSNLRSSSATGIALETGYRHIDTAQAYYNEEGVGRAVAKSGVARDELFLTTKVWIYHAGEKNAAASIDGSLHKLGCDYVDLLLVHQPFGDYYGTWRALEAAYRSGKARAIGVSSFYPDRLVDLCRFSEIKPMVDQVETHVFQQQRAGREVMDRYGVAHESWGRSRRAATASSRTRRSRPWARSTARRPPRRRCASSSRAAWPSFPNPRARSAWPRTSRCSTSSWTQRTWTRFARSTREKAFSSAIMTRNPSSP